MFSRILLVVAAALFAANSVAAYRNGTDLISLHYDHAPDRDDGHATVAGLMVTSRFDITPHVVSGTYGDGNSHRYVREAEAVMQATWGNQWLNADANWAAAVSATADQWLNTLNTGGNVFVAEGGQSDFSADVVRNIRGRSNVDTSARITVVQHSDWNERQANPADLAYVRNNTTYVKIADGNLANSTADLFQGSNSFVATARASRFADEWNAAFAYLNPNQKLDFSDTVELLHILDIGKNIVATVNDFAEEFFQAPIKNVVTPVADMDPEVTDPVVTNPVVTDPVVTDNTSDTAPDSNSDATNNIVPKPQADPVVLAFPECSASVTDSDGDGYGWENARSCLIVSTSVPTENTQNDQPLEAQEVDMVTPVFPVCSAEVIDSDSDGYGWENYQTCQTTQTAAEPQAVESITVYPTCSSAAIDNDGDGYALENDSSCVVSQQPSDTALPLTPPTTTNPICSASVVDDNGDGYGWENNQNCLIDTSNSISPVPVHLVSFPACSATANDDDGDGFSWEDNATCIIAPNGAATVTLVSFPSCSASLTDTDGDGYGWENNQTCVFSIARDVTSATNGVALMSFPTCSAAVIDTDGDGYGWENNASCTIIESHALQPSQVEAAGMAYPVCSTALVDTDGDGFGWENNKSCLFPDSFPNPSALLPFPACSANIVDYDADGYGWEADASCVFR